MAHASDQGCSGGWGRRITWAREAEVAVSWDCATGLQLGWRSRLHLKNKQINKWSKIKLHICQDAVAYACNPSTLGGQGRCITWGQEFDTSLANMVKSHLYKNMKISWAWWRVTVIPPTWEAEVEQSLEPGRWKLHWAEIVSLHSSLGDKVRLCLI